ncbi:MAG: periplasmic heavy metal sensor [Ignavibacteriae bacterium]|nr:periplasmic heavy metal sensor [Ignavibacteriota bacterium]
MKRTLVALMLTMAITFTAMAQPGGRARQHKVPPHAAIMKDLNLTDAQETQVQKLQINLQKKQTDLRAKVQNLYLDTKEQFLADKVDRAAIEKNVKAISDIQEQMKLAMLNHWFDVNALLTPEQQKIWKNHALRLGQAWHQRMRGMRMGMGMDPGMGNPDED